LARKKLKIPDTKFRGQMGNEESWQGQVRVEVKAGKQVQTIWTKYLKAKEQSDTNTRIGDTRPFVFVAMPDGTSNGLVVFEIDKIEEVVVSLLETWNGEIH
jgi:hypothetical protein